MANPEHVAVVRRGVNQIRDWKLDHPDEGLDFGGAYFSNAFLRGADLRKANLHGTQLSAANLSSANLIEADLREADLSLANLGQSYLQGANLREANLSGALLIKANLLAAVLDQADLAGADLTNAILGNASIRDANLFQTRLRANLFGADLRGSNLRGVDLFTADLREVDFSDTQCAWTVFANVDLSSTKGLANVQHYGPSTLGIDTLYRSQGGIPDEFLRGCGVPEKLIADASSYFSSIAHCPRYFISCSPADDAFARRLHEAALGRGMHWWLDDHQIAMQRDGS